MIAEAGISFTQVADGKLKGEFTRALADKLARAQNPMIVIIIGKTREGKSTVLNQILLDKTVRIGSLRIKVPFAAAGGTDPKTKEFQFYGPIKASELCRRNMLPLIGQERDIFFMDTEGAGNLYEMTNNLHHGVFALESVSSCTLFMSKATIERDTIQYIQRHLQVSRFFAKGSKAYPGLALIARDVGLNVESDDLDVRERARREQDRTNRERFERTLNEGTGINFNKSNLCYIAEPFIDERDLFLNSIKDLVTFILKNGSSQEPKTGSDIIKRFAAADSVVGNYPELLDTKCSMEEMFKKIFNSELKKVERAAIEEGKTSCSSELTRMNASTFFSLIQEVYVTEALKIMEDLFKRKANEMFEGIESIASDIYSVRLNSAKSKVQTEVSIIFISKREELVGELNKVIESAKKAAIQKMSSEASSEVSRMTPSDLRKLDTKAFIEERGKKSEECFSTTANGTVQGIAKICVVHSFYVTTQSNVKLEVMKRIEDLLNTKYSSASVWPKNVSELLKEQEISSLTPGNSYTLYIGQKPYTVIAKSGSEVTLPDVNGTAHHRKEQLECWGGKRMDIDNNDSLDIKFNPDSHELMVKNANVFKNNWCEGGHTSLFGGTKPPKPQQETRTFTIHVGAPWSIFSYEKSGGNVIAELKNGSHDLSVCSNGGSGNVSNIKVTLAN